MIAMPSRKLKDSREQVLRVIGVIPQVEEITFSLSKAPEHEGHGIVIKIKGTKKQSLIQPPMMALDVLPGRFWAGAEVAFGAFAVSLAK